MAHTADLRYNVYCPSWKAIYKLYALKQPVIPNQCFIRKPLLPLLKKETTPWRSQVPYVNDVIENREYMSGWNFRREEREDETTALRRRARCQTQQEFPHPGTSLVASLGRRFGRRFHRLLTYVTSSSVISRTWKKHVRLECLTEMEFAF